jgi:uncharacterized radical SAM superfamily Fe-S cluster-containing enzyme
VVRPDKVRGPVSRTTFTGGEPTLRDDCPRFLPREQNGQVAC